MLSLGLCRCSIRYYDVHSVGHDPITMVGSSSADEDDDGGGSVGGHQTMLYSAGNQNWIT